MTPDDNALPKPFDRTELENCQVCGKGVLKTGDIHFYEVTVTQCIADIRSIQQQHGLEMMLGGAAGVAAALAPSTNVAHRMPGKRLLLCSHCAMRDTPVALMLEGE